MVECEFEFPPDITVNGTVIVEVKIPQWCLEPAFPYLGLETQDLARKERLAIPRAFSGD
jgi:hypothetical protein